VAEIAAASREQAQGIEQIGKAVTEMDQVVQQNAANAEESASASEELNAQAEQMKNYVEDLNVLVGGNKSGANKEDYGTNPPESAKISRDGRGRKPNQLNLLPYKTSASVNKGNGRNNRRSVEPNMSPASADQARPEHVIPFGDEEFKDF